MKDEGGDDADSKSDSPSEVSCRASFNYPFSFIFILFKNSFFFL